MRYLRGTSFSNELRNGRREGDWVRGPCVGLGMLIEKREAGMTAGRVERWPRVMKSAVLLCASAHGSSVALWWPNFDLALVVGTGAAFAAAVVVAVVAMPVAAAGSFVGSATDVAAAADVVNAEDDQVACLIVAAPVGHSVGIRAVVEVE